VIRIFAAFIAACTPVPDDTPVMAACGCVASVPGATLIAGRTYRTPAGGVALRTHVLLGPPASPRVSAPCYRQLLAEVDLPSLVLDPPYARDARTVWVEQDTTCGTIWRQLPLAAASTRRMGDYLTDGQAVYLDHFPVPAHAPSFTVDARGCARDRDGTFARFERGPCQ
jgi:hypothetical protein